MKKFKIKVNGKQYEVEVDEVKDGSVQQAEQSAPVEPAAPAKPAEPAPKQEEKESAPAPSKSVPADAEAIESPMPGTILKVNVSEGDQVKKGDVLCILEAMKMENEIVAQKDGTIASVNVQVDTSVDAGDALLSIG